MVKKKKNPPGILDWIVDFFIEPIKKAISDLVNQVKGEVTYKPAEEIASDVQTDLKTLATEALSLIEPRSVTTPGDAFELYPQLVNKANKAYSDFLVAVTLVEAVSLGQLDIGPSLALGIPSSRAALDTAADLVKEQFKIGVLFPLGRYWNSVYRPTLPGAQDLPSMLWRGKITEDKFKEVLAEQGFSEEFVAAYIELARLIPGYGDLITLMVREIITPADFITWIGRQGYSSYWASALYDAHFRLPSPEHVYDAFHRGLISEAELNKYIFWHDYQPTPRPDISKTDLAIMRGLTKTLIPRVDLRRAWLQGEISSEELESRYGWLGYEDDAPLMARIQKAVALTPQRNQVRNLFLRALRKGVKTESEVRARLKELRYPGAAVDLLIEAENVRREIGAVELGEEPRILSTSQITRAYKSRLITRSAAAEMLAAQGWDPGAADMLLMLSEPVPEKVDQLSAVKTAAATLYREGYMSPEEFEGHLRGANYSDDDIARIRLAEDLRYRWDFLKDLQAADVEAYRKDILTLEELTSRLLERDLQPERAAALLAKEAYKKLPKPKPA